MSCHVTPRVLDVVLVYMPFAGRRPPSFQGARVALAVVFLWTVGLKWGVVVVFFLGGGREGYRGEATNAAAENNQRVRCFCSPAPGFVSVGRLSVWMEPLPFLFPAFVSLTDASFVSSLLHSPARGRAGSAAIAGFVRGCALRAPLRLPCRSWWACTPATSRRRAATGGRKAWCSWTLTTTAYTLGSTKTCELWARRSKRAPVIFVLHVACLLACLLVSLSLSAPTTIAGVFLGPKRRRACVACLLPEIPVFHFST